MRSAIVRVTPNFAVPAGGMTVRLSAHGGSATEGDDADYTLSPNPLTFAAGDAVPGDGEDHH